MAYSRCRYHVCFATKFRRPSLTSEVERLVHAVQCHRARQLGGYILEIESAWNHTHQIAAIPPSIAVDEFIRKVKSASTAAVRGALDPSFGWQDGFGVETLAARDYARAQRYVRNQKSHHRRSTLITHWERAGA